MDISKAADFLFSGAVPERVEEMKATWGEQVDRVRLQDGEGFMLQQTYGIVQVSEIALRLIWLICFRAWKAVEAYNDAIPHLLAAGKPFDLDLLAKIPCQSVYDAKFDRAMDEVRRLATVWTLDDFQWPDDVPEPQVGMAQPNDRNHRAAFDLSCLAAAYVFLHEIRHGQLSRDERHQLTMIDEEKECDRYARDVMLGKVDKYAEVSGVSEDLVKGKRGIGILLAKMVILVITPRHLWSASADHPTVKDRIREVLKQIPDSAPEGVWPTCAGLLAVFARHYELVGEPVSFSSCRDLAFTLCEKFGA